MKGERMLNRGRKKGVEMLRWIVGLLMVSQTLLMGASVHAELLENPLSKGDVATLEIVAQGHQVVFPDIQQIAHTKVLDKREHTTLSTTQIGSTIQRQEKTTLRLRFAPQASLTIPSYKVEIDGAVYETQPIRLKILTEKEQAKRPPMVVLHLKSEKQKVMVGEVFPLKVLFKERKGVRFVEQPRFAKPDFQGFFVKPIDKMRQYEEGGYHITELSYLLTAQAEGNYTISPATIQFATADRKHRDIFGNYGVLWHQVASNSLTIEVKPAPDGVSLVGDFSLTSKIDHTEVKVNEPVNVTIHIEGEGSLEDFEFPSYEIDGVSVYGNEPTIQTSLKKGRVWSSYEQTFALIGEHHFKIPKVSIPFFNPKSQKKQMLHTPSYEVDLKGRVEQNSGVISTQTAPLASSKEATASTPLSKEKQGFLFSWWILLLGVVLGVMGTLLLKNITLRVPRRSLSLGISEAEALKRLYPYVSQSQEIEEMVEKLYAKEVKRASVKIDKKALKALLQSLEQK